MLCGSCTFHGKNHFAANAIPRCLEAEEDEEASDIHHVEEPAEEELLVPDVVRVAPGRPDGDRMTFEQNLRFSLINFCQNSIISSNFTKIFIVFLHPI